MDFKKWSNLKCLNILLLLCTYKLVLSKRQCTPGIATPGYTVPHGDIVIEYGDPLDILCVVVDTNNANLSFVKNEDKLPTEIINFVNSTAISLHIEKPNKASGDTYICLQGDTMVCMNRVTIGVKPQTVTDFDCIGHNYDNFTCSWTAPNNYAATDYNLTYTLGGRSARVQTYTCPEILKSDTNNRMSCFWNVSTTPPYRLVHEVYNMTLTMSNRFGTNSINTVLNHWARVLSGPPENLTVISTTPSSIYLYWMVPFSMQNFPPGLNHRILYQCEYGEKKWHHGGLIVDLPNQKELYFNLTDLKYAHVLCDIRVSSRSAKALPDDESMWSRNASINVRTSSKVPDEPPETNVGGFLVAAFGSSIQYREAYIYWKQIREEQKNGPHFRYTIAAMGNSSIKPIETTNNYAKFENLSISKSYIFNIWSENANGTSIRKSTVFIPKQIDRIKEPQSFTKIALKDGEYELTWEPPELLPYQHITNYSIFYCKNDVDIPFQCNGPLKWEVVSNDTMSKYMKLEKGKMFQFAISANTHNSSSGMLWAACTIFHNENMGKIKTVWIDYVGPTFIEVRWRLDCSDQIGSVEGYIVYYCPIKSPSHTECKAPQRNTTFHGSSIKAGNITNLNPYTTYMLTVSVITKHTTFSQQSDPLYNTTLEAAPTSIKNLKAVNITNSTITLDWDPPEAINGILKFYQIEYLNANYHPVRIRTETSNCTLSNLRSYERYNITVTACTVYCSEKSRISVITSMGYPSKIRKPTVDRRNDSSITITWSEPYEPGGKIDHYTVQFKQKHKYENKTLTRDRKTREFVIQNCGDGGKFNTFYISVRAVNKIKGVYYNGPWSDELENYCETPVNYIMYILLFGVISVMVLLGYMITRLYHHCKRMRDVEVKLPPGLAPVVADHTIVPWSTEKHQENRSSYSPPDEELLLVKMTEGRHCSGDSSGCSSGHDSVTSSLESGTHISSSSDSGTEQQRNYCALGVDSKIDSSYVPVTATDANKSPYKACDVSTESSPYVMSGDAVKTINPGYIPFNQIEPIGKSTDYVVAGIKNCNGYIPFNQTDSVNRNTGYVVAGIKSCKLD